MRKRILTGLAFVAAVSLMSGCGGKKQAATEKSDKILVKTFVAHTEPVEQLAQFTSSIDAYKTNNIAGIAARIDRILVEVGSYVSKGQLLAAMDPTQHDAAAIQLANSELDYQRLKTVSDAGGVSQQQIDQAEAALKVSKTQLQNIKDNTFLVSPISGIVTARNYDAGDMYVGGLPILTVMQTNPLKVTMDVSEQYIPDVKKGTKVDIEADVYPDKTFAGKVSLIYPAVDPATRTFKVEVTIPNQGNLLRPGMFSRSTIHFGVEDGIMVEDLAVQKQVGSSEKYVFVIEDGVAHRRTVSTGRQIDNKINILSGIEAGEHIAVAGMSKLMEGALVDVRNE